MRSDDCMIELHGNRQRQRMRRRERRGSKERIIITVIAVLVAGEVLSLGGRKCHTCSSPLKSKHSGDKITQPNPKEHHFYMPCIF